MLSNPYTIEKTGWVFPRVVMGGGICLWSYFSILPKTATINRYSQKQKDYNVLSLPLPTCGEWEEMEVDALIRNKIYIFTSKDSKRLWCHTELVTETIGCCLQKWFLVGKSEAILGESSGLYRSRCLNLALGNQREEKNSEFQSHALPLFECPGQACSFHT